MRAFIDRAAKVKEDRRPGDMALIDAVRSGDVQKVIDVDRVGRSLVDLVTFMEVHRAAGVSLWLDEQRFDAAGATVCRFSALRR